MKVTITLNGGKEFNIDAPSYDASALAKSMNDAQVTMINIGNVVLGKHSIMMIAPYPMEEIVPETESN